MVEGGVIEWGRQQRLQAGSDFVLLFYTSGERAPWGLRNRSALLGGKQPPPRSSLLREGGVEHLPLSRLLPPFPSLCLILPSCPCGMGWQRGLEVWGWVGAGPSEAHVERSAGKGAAAAVSQSVPGSLVPAGYKSREHCFQSRESQPPSVGCTMTDSWMGRGTALSPTPLAPVGSGGHLLSGSSLSQDCARRVLLGFRGAVRRPESGGPEMTVKAGLAHE